MSMEMRNLFGDLLVWTSHSACTSSD